ASLAATISTRCNTRRSAELLPTIPGRTDSLKASSVSDSSGFTVVNSGRLIGPNCKSSCGCENDTTFISLLPEELSVTLRLRHRPYQPQQMNRLATRVSGCTIPTAASGTSLPSAFGRKSDIPKLSAPPGRFANLSFDVAGLTSM